ncbi:MAG: hypothetical protein IKK72_06325, partial [Oscillospiraceae bacterium]|nr:hypothetical protein [Oscillospiraceae bacterium]
PAVVCGFDGGAGSGNLSGIPEKTASISYGASNAFVYTKCNKKCRYPNGYLHFLAEDEGSDCQFAFWQIVW